MFPALVVATAALAAQISPAAAIVTINQTARQTITSFGASGAWWVNDLYNYPQEKQVELGNFLFSREGIWLSSYRYNLGANGGNDTHECYTPNRIVQSPLLTNGTYDFSRDQAGQTFLKMAQNHSVPYITFFLNAAPSHIAGNNQACGWDFTSNKTTDYANYIATVLSYWTDHGINISYVSPMNEPDYIHTFCDQEGMAVGPDKRAPIFKAIRQALDGTSAKNVGVIGDETSQATTQGETTYPQWLPDGASSLSNIAIHNYDFPTDDKLAGYYDLVMNLTNNQPPPIKFTETCCAKDASNGPTTFGAEYDPGMGNALIVARQVWQFMTIVQAESFDWWNSVAALPCSPTVDGAQCATAFNATNGFNSGLVYIDPNYNQTKDYNLYYTKRAYLLKHFSHFHRPGAVRYDVDQTQLPMGVNAIATKSAWSAGDPWFEKHGTWNVLFMNNQTTPQSFEMQAPDRFDVLSQIVQTTPSVDWGKVPILPFVLRSGTMNVTLPAQSLWSLRFAKAV